MKPTSRSLARAALVATVLIGPAASSRAGEPLGTPTRVTLEARNGQHSFTVALAKRPFVRGRRRVRVGEGSLVYVDGRRAYGALDYAPHEEMSAFEVTVDGKKWPVPARLWRDCYGPNLGTSNTGTKPEAVYTYAWLSADGERLTVKMLGSDGGGGYRVVWYLRRDGKHHRRIDDLT